MSSDRAVSTGSRADDTTRMSPAELRAGLSLAGVFGLRMLGLFFILPIFAIDAPRLAGGDSMTLVGIALGAYPEKRTPAISAVRALATVLRPTLFDDRALRAKFRSVRARLADASPNRSAHAAFEDRLHTVRAQLGRDLL